MLSTVSHVQGSIDDVKGVVRRALKSSAFVIMPIMVYAAVAAPSLIAILLGEQWLPALPYFQFFCVIYALLPIHTTNLQALNGLGRSDWFLKLEIIKKSYGLIILLFTAFVLKDAYWICVGLLASGIISTFVNAFPNSKIINYSYLEQIKDLAPILLITTLSAFFGIGIAKNPFIALSPITCALAQFFLMSITYVLLAAAIRIDTLQFIMTEIFDRLPFTHTSSKHNRK